MRQNEKIMKLLITGAGGFLGSRLLCFYRKKYEVIGIGRKELELTAEKKVLEALQAYRPDVLLHCAAVSDVAACEQDPEGSFLINVKAAVNLARACGQTGTKMVFCSSDQVYFTENIGQAEPAAQQGVNRSCLQAAMAAPGLVPHKEKEALCPRPVYGRQKLLAEQLCVQELPACVCLRLSWMYGLLTDREKAGGRNNLAMMLWRAMKENGTLAFSDTDFRGVTDVGLVVEQMEKVWQLPGGVYNFGSGNDCSMYETACRVTELLGKEPFWGKTYLGKGGHLASEAPGNQQLSLERSTGSGLRNLTMDGTKAAAYGIVFPDTAEGLAAFLKDLISGVQG